MSRRRLGRAFAAILARVRVIAGVVKRRRRTIAISALLVVLVATLGVVYYLETPSRGDQARLDAIADREDVHVERTDGDYVLRGGPVTTETVGLIIYPGARVHSESYLWTLAPIAAQQDVLIVIPEMPLNLALLDSDAADDVMAATPAVDRWVVGGHSLGGAMACQHTAGGADVEGLVLLAAYCDDGDDLHDRRSDRDLPVLSVQGTADGVIDRETERANRQLLGPRRTVVEIEGMNHAQFGAYGSQRGDRPATIDDENAREQLVAAVLRWLDTDIRR